MPVNKSEEGPCLTSLERERPPTRKSLFSTKREKNLRLFVHLRPPSPPKTEKEIICKLRSFGLEQAASQLILSCVGRGTKDDSSIECISSLFGLRSKVRSPNLNRFQGWGMDKNGQKFTRKTFPPLSFASSLPPIKMTLTPKVLRGRVTLNKHCDTENIFKNADL